MAGEIFNPVDKEYLIKNWDENNIENIARTTQCHRKGFCSAESLDEI